MSLFSAFFGESKRSADKTVETPLDLVTYAAGLASNPDTINTTLDTVRSITARLGPADTPSAQDQAKLLGVYLKIEEYLTTEEPLRAFTKQGLRKRLATPLLDQLTKYETGQGATLNVKT